MRKIHKEFKDQYNYTGSVETLRKIMKKIGSRWRKTKTDRKLFIEKPDIRHSILNFLKKYEKVF